MQKPQKNKYENIPLITCHFSKHNTNTFRVTFVGIPFCGLLHTPMISVVKGTKALSSPITFSCHIFAGYLYRLLRLSDCRYNPWKIGHRSQNKLSVYYYYYYWKYVQTNTKAIILFICQVIFSVTVQHCASICCYFCWTCSKNKMATTKSFSQEAVVK